MSSKNRIAAIAAVLCLAGPVVAVAVATPASAATSTKCGVIASWKYLGYSPKLTDNALFHTKVYYRNLSDGKMDFCVGMIADKKPRGRKMEMKLKPEFGKAVNASTTGGTIYRNVTLLPHAIVVVNMVFIYDNPAKENGKGTVKEQFGLNNWRG